METRRTCKLRIFRVELVAFVAIRATVHNELERCTVLVRLLTRDNALEMIGRRLAAVEHVLRLCHCRDDLHPHEREISP